MLKIENIRTIVCGAYQENAYLVCPDGRDDAFLVDPGDDLSTLTHAIGQSGRKLTDILLTHGHFDHTLAAQPLADETGARVWIASGDAEMLSDGIKSAYTGTGEFVATLPHPSGLCAEYYGAGLSTCGVTFQVLPTPGHSRGSVCLYVPEAGILFSGDTLFCAGFGRTDLFGGNHLEMLQSLRQLFTLPPETRVYSGHGPQTTIYAERSHYA